MDTLLRWLGENPPGVVVLLALGAAVLYLARQVIDEAVAGRVDLVFREQNLRLERRSAFADRVLTDRYTIFNDLTSRLVSISTDLNLLRSGAQTARAAVPRQRRARAADARL